MFKRAVVNRWLNPMGYDISAMLKPWSFGPFGRDSDAVVACGVVALLALCGAVVSEDGRFK